MDSPTASRSWLPASMRKQVVIALVLLIAACVASFSWESEGLTGEEPLQLRGGAALLDGDSAHVDALIDLVTARAKERLQSNETEDKVRATMQQLLDEVKRLHDKVDSLQSPEARGTSRLALPEPSPTTATADTDTTSTLEQAESSSTSVSPAVSSSSSAVPSASSSDSVPPAASPSSAPPVAPVPVSVTETGLQILNDPFVKIDVEKLAPWPLGDPAQCSGMNGNGFDSPFQISDAIKCKMHGHLKFHYCIAGMLHRCGVWRSVARVGVFSHC